MRPLSLGSKVKVFLFKIWFSLIIESFMILDQNLNSTLKLVLQVDRQKNRQMNRQMDIWMERWTVGWAVGQRDRQVDRQTDERMYRPTNRQTDGQLQRLTNRQADVQYLNYKLELQQKMNFIRSDSKLDLTLSRHFQPKVLPQMRTYNQVETECLMDKAT